ncbi:MAG: 4-(cytidine 5'-diphospho)-2-C-methyl-D-erythritol kinase [Fimbriimonadales bacterium]
MRIERDAPAKINLTLEVLGRRSDGYHEIASVMHTLSLCDTLVLELPDAPILDAAQGEILISGEFTGGGEDSIPADPSNLIWKTVEAFVQNSPRPLNHSPALWQRGQGGEGSGWRAYLTKRIPAQAGLGGGSSDAAAALKILADWARWWKIAQPNLYTIASKLGADVAFFGGDADGTASSVGTPTVRGGGSSAGTPTVRASPPTPQCALATGKGEQLKPLPALLSFWWVLAKPYGVGVPTAWAYAQLKREAVPPNARPRHTERLVNALREGVIKTPADLAPLLHNDFDEPILRALPELRVLRQRLEAEGALRVILCGSGAAQAGLCQSREEAERIAAALRAEGYWAVATQTNGPDASQQR